MASDTEETERDDGKFSTQYDDDDILHFLIESFPEPVVNQEVADAIGCSKSTAFYRLNDLQDDGLIRSKKVGAKAVVWWINPSVIDPSEIDPTGMIDKKLDELGREDVIKLTSWFGPDFNPTRTGTEKMVEYLSDRPFVLLQHAWYEVFHGE